jgi:hypothetical protein
MAGAGAVLVFSFFPFYRGSAGLGSTNAWGSGLFPLSTLIVISAVAAGVLVAMVRFANVQYPPGGFLGFGYHHLLLALTFFATIVSVAYLAVDKGPFASSGVGLWLMLLGSAAALVGAVIVTNEARAKA